MKNSKIKEMSMTRLGHLKAPGAPWLSLDLLELRSIHGANFVAEGRGIFHPDRILPVHDLLFNISGRRSVMVGPHRFDLVDGDILLLPAGIRHFAPEGNGTAVRSAYLHFSTHAGDRYDAGSAKDVAPSQPPRIALPLHRRGFSDPQMSSLFEELILLEHAAASIRRFRARVLLTDLLLRLARNEAPGAGGTLVDLLLERIDRNPGSTESLDDYAARYGVNRRTLCRRFKAATGKSIHRYRLEARIRSASHTLRVAPQSTVRELADQLGFSDPFHFSRAFKAQLGLSPRAYLHRVRSGEAP